MPLPKVKKNETRQEYVARCIPVEKEAGKSDEQSFAICSQVWEKAQLSDSPDYQIALSEKLDSSVKSYKVLELGEMKTEKYGKIQVVMSRDEVKPGSLAIPVQDIVDHFKMGVLGTEPFIDEEHDRGRAKGWIKDVFIQDNALWLSIDWNPKGKELVDNGEYAYLSIDVGTAIFEGKKYTDVLRGAGLTNKPVYKNQEKIQLSISDSTESNVEMEKSNKGENQMEKLIEMMETLLDALKEGIAGEEAEQVKASIKEYMDQLSALISEPEMEPGDEAGEGEPAQMSDNTGSIKLSEALEEIKTLKTQVVKLSQENQASKFDAKYLHKKVTPANRDQFFELYLSNQETTETILAGMPDLNVSGAVGFTGNGEKFQLSEEDKDVMKGVGLDPDSAEDVKKYRKYLGGK